LLSAALLGLAGCVPVDDFGPAVWVDNRSHQTLYVSTSSTGFQAWLVPSETFGQAQFVAAGSTLYVLNDGCEVLGSVDVSEDDQSLVIAVDLTISVDSPPAGEQILLEDAVWAPPCEPSASPST